MPSSEHSSPTIDVMKRLVAQQKSTRHQHHEPMADELSSCPTTPIYNKVAHDTTTDQRLQNNRVAADQPIASKKEPLVSKTSPTSQPTANSQRQTAKQPTANNQTANGKQPTANSQQQTANGQQPTANSQQPTANSVRYRSGRSRAV